MQLNTKMEETLRVLRELSDAATLSEISEQLRLVGYRKKIGTIVEELDKLCEMEYVFHYSGGGNFYEILGKGIVHFQIQTQN